MASASKPDTQNMNMKPQTNEQIPDDWWTNGYCSVFAYALHLRFNMPMYAFLERAKKDGDVTLIHAVGVKNDRAYDATGQINVILLLEDYKASHKQGTSYYGGEESTIQFVRISKRRLDRIHDDFDLSLLPQAYALIDRYPERFQSTPMNEG